MMSTMEIDILFDEGFEDSLDEKWLREIIEAVLKAENGDNIEMACLSPGRSESNS